MTTSVSRRALLTSAGAAVAVETLATGARTAEVQTVESLEQATSPNADGLLFFFNDEEGRFVTATISQLIPADPQWGGAVEAGVLTFIDRQLASAYGAGGRMFLDGPWSPEAPPQQGYQLRFTPAELYRVAIEETRAAIRNTYSGRELWDLGETVIVDVLKGLESGALQLPSLPAPVFFETLLANTIEGFFADPAYGGNRNMIGWRMVGFPGAYAQYADLIEMYGLVYERPPIGIADEVERQRHLQMHPHTMSDG